MKKRLRVLLLIPHLGGGGAEQVTALLARGLSREKYDLHLGLITQPDPGKENLPSRVSIHVLGASRVRTAAWMLLRLIRRLKPDVILSGMAHLNFLVLLLRPFFPLGTCVLVRQNATVSAALAFGDLPGYTRLLYHLLYRHSDRVICQTSAMANDIAEELRIPENRLVVLPNPVDVEAIRAAVEETPNRWNGQESSSAGLHLLAVGRLSREKGFDLLLHAMVKVRQRFPEVDLVIAGAGPEEIALKALCLELGIESTVRFAGYLERPSAYFPGATAFVLSSRHEGMPNALLEAAASGLPIVAVPASAGVTDLLRGRPGTWLSPEVTSAALAVSLLAALDTLHHGERFVHPFIGEFAVDRAVRAYEHLIDTSFKERSK